MGMFDDIDVMWILKVAVTVIVVGAALAGIVYAALLAWAEKAYDYMNKHPKTKCDADAFIQARKPDEYKPNKLKVAMGIRSQISGSRKVRETPIALECTPSPHVDGLWVTRSAEAKKDGDDSDSGKSKEKATPLRDLLPRTDQSGKIVGDGKKTVVVATIRMGFGHHRIAYSTCSWALKQGYTTIFHDLLNIDSEESKLIGQQDKLYSLVSRIATEMGGPIEALLSSLTMSGDHDALRIAALTAAHLQPLITAFPKDIPFITSHQTAALAASCAGFTNVVNLVVDNYPQWFLTVPNAMNFVQGPVNYHSFMRMGVSPKELHLAGNWNPHDMVTNIPKDCANRIKRCEEGLTEDSKGSIQPRRLVIPVGGAGAQKAFIIKMIKRFAPLVKKNKLQLFLNAADHAHMKTAFTDVLDETDLKYDSIDTTDGVYSFQKKLLDGGEPDKNVTLFAFDDYFPAVATTDILCRVADVLVCKPSEMAFYAVPKLHIRRVGNHEAQSAIRSSEVGDGTQEARTHDEVMDYLDLMCNAPYMLRQMNESIMKNHEQGMYHGCREAVAYATEQKTIKK